MLLVLNSAYLAGFATPGFFYVGNSLLHPALGILCAALLAAYVVRRWSLFRRGAGLALILLALGATAFGIYLAAAGMTSRHRLALDAHVAFALATLAALLVWLRRRARRSAPEPVAAPPRGDEAIVAPLDHAGSSGVIKSRFFAALRMTGASVKNRFFAALSMTGGAGMIGRGRVGARRTGPPLAAGERAAWRWGLGAILASAALYGGAVLAHHYTSPAEFNVRNPQAPLTMAQEGGGPHSLVWPSSAQIVNKKPLPESYFMNSKSCEPCHSDIYRQWESSMHHYASFNNQWYRKTIEYMQDTVGIKPSLWCGGCHDQALSFTGYMEKDPIRQIEHTPAGQNGLGCVSCHSVAHVASTMGQADFVFKYPDLASYAESANPVMHDIAYYEVLLNPKAHASVFFKPFHHQPQEVAKFCSACHKVHMDVPVNHYRWIRGFDEYDNWQASGTDWQGARSFYYPPKPENCVNCHMPLVRSRDFGNIGGFVHSHRFAAANTAVPESHGDTGQIAAVEKFLKGALSVDIFALAEEPSASALGPGREQRANYFPSAPQLSTDFAQGEESSRGMIAAVTTVGPPGKLIAPLGRVKPALHRGETVRVEVVVRTLKLGHFFPGGTVDAYDCWLELKAHDNKGHIIFWSGEAANGGSGPVDPSAHFYHSLQLDAHGNTVNKRDTWLTRAVVYTHLIPPGAADTVHYKLIIPKNCGDRITLTARLNYRKFSWWYTQWAFAGVRAPSDEHYGRTYNYDDGRWVFTGSLAGVSAKEPRIPDVPTVVIAQQSLTLPVAAGSAPPFTQDLVLNRQDLIRWNDYGIGLLLQGDLKGAERAFRIVTEENPSYADGWANVARAMVQEGDTAAAEPLLRKALRLNPRLGSAHYFFGLALKADGEYPQAYGQFALAAARYPNDRVVRNQMGRMLFLQREYREAAAEYQRTLAIDPEDLEAHYNMMLCDMGMGESKQAAREEKLYLRFKANEAATTIAGRYDLAHPDENNEAQPIHEHTTVPLTEIAHPPASWYTPYQLKGARSEVSGVRERGSWSVVRGALRAGR